MAAGIVIAPLHVCGYREIPPPPDMMKEAGADNLRETDGFFLNEFVDALRGVVSFRRTCRRNLVVSANVRKV